MKLVMTVLFVLSLWSSVHARPLAAPRSINTVVSVDLIKMNFFLSSDRGLPEEYSMQITFRCTFTDGKSLDKEYTIPVETLPSLRRAQLGEMRDLLIDRFIAEMGLK